MTFNDNACGVHLGWNNNTHRMIKGVKYTLFGVFVGVGQCPSGQWRVKSTTGNGGGM